MKSDDPDPVCRWREVAAFFAAWSSEEGWGHLAPMIGLAKWISFDAMAGRLYPTTSLDWLRIELKPGFDYVNGRPCVAGRARRDGLFECELSSAAGESLERKLVPIAQAGSAFADLIGRLLQGEESA